MTEVVAHEPQKLIATLWTRSTASAQSALDALRAEVEAERETAHKAVESTQAGLSRTETALEQCTSALLAAQVRIQELEQAQAAAEATRRALEAHIARLQQENAASDHALVQARADFSRELEKLRADTGRDETRLQASEKRALLEIERERSQASRLQKDLDAAARRAEQRRAVPSSAKRSIATKRISCVLSLAIRVIKRASRKAGSTRWKRPALRISANWPSCDTRLRCNRRARKRRRSDRAWRGA